MRGAGLYTVRRVVRARGNLSGHVGPQYCSVVGLRSSGLFEGAIVCSSMSLLGFKPYETKEVLNAPLLCETEP